MFIAEPQITRNLPGFRFHCKLGTQTTFVKRLLRFASPLRNFSLSFPYALLFCLSLSNLPEFLKLFPHCSGARRTHRFGLKTCQKYSVMVSILNQVNVDNSFQEKTQILITQTKKHHPPKKNPKPQKHPKQQKNPKPNKKQSQHTFSPFLQICEPQTWFINEFDLLWKCLSNPTDCQY